MKPKPKVEMTPEMQKIDEILDRTVRPGLQGDGGDIEVLSFEPKEKKVYIHYQGACGTCPSSTAGTLMAIESILRDEFDPECQVIPV
jgi:Fe-S cluster biogenesis protein NfuA